MSGRNMPDEERVMLTPEKRPLPLMRSVLTVPAIVPRFIEKAPASGADVVCLDLEDSVPPEEKAAARIACGKAVQQMPRDGFSLFVRVNAFTSGLLEDDVAVVVQRGLDGIILS